MQTRRNLKHMIPKIRKKSPIHENTGANITWDFCYDRCRIAAARLEKDFVRTDFPIVVKITDALMISPVRAYVYVQDQL